MGTSWYFSWKLNYFGIPKWKQGLFNIPQSGHESVYLLEPSFHSRTPNNSTFMKNISWCPCLKVRVNFYPRRNYAAHFTVTLAVSSSAAGRELARAHSLLAATAAQPCHCPRWWWGWPSSVSTIIRCCCVSTSLQPWQGYSLYKLSIKFLSSRLFISGNKITLSPSAWSWSTHFTANHTPLAWRRGQWASGPGNWPHHIQPVGCQHKIVLYRPGLINDCGLERRL